MKTIIALLALVAVAGTAVAAPQTNETAQPAATQALNKGKVLEVIDTSMYTYLQVSSDASPVWIAVAKTDIAKGATIAYANGALMSNFHSKSLNRTFDKIIFLDKVEVIKKK